MTKIERLKREAREIATRLGHHLERFRPSVITEAGAATSQRPVEVAACPRCGAVVMVNPAPVPGEEAITGEGVMRPCVAIEQEGHEMA